ncbi:MAG: hypothetical protein B6D37_01865 [Sphingobacteriales bacterium UTBCD1]|jgi:uncharacterized membrane protein|nr:MAG: hypothetical protein B6D37_01865 [Sphingobacteriales bacterium UTBCD1]
MIGLRIILMAVCISVIIDIFIPLIKTLMKKITVFTALAGMAFALSYCNVSKKAANKAVAMNYETNVKEIIAANCSPCHFPAEGGKKEPLDSYADVTKHIDDILRRIQLNPADRGFMPNRHAKLSDSTINVLKQWKTDGLKEN